MTANPTLRDPCRNRLLTLSLFVVCACGFHGRAAAQTRADTVIPVDGANYRGSVTNVSPVAVTIILQGRETDVPVNEIREIAFSEEPTAMRQTREAISKGQLEQAAQTIQRVDPASLEREVVQQEYEYLRAEVAARTALQGGGEAAEAARQMLSFLRRNKSSYHFYAAVETLGDLAMRLGSYENAAKYYAQLSKTPWPQTQARAAVLEAGALRAQGKSSYPQAIQKYAGLLATPATLPEVERQQAFAQAGKAACEADLGKTLEGIASLEKLIAQTDVSDTELFAAIYNALGDCHRINGQKEDALLDYLHVDTMFYRDADAHAEALYWLGQLWAETGDNARAEEARQLLNARYGHTPWARR